MFIQDKCITGRISPEHAETLPEYIRSMAGMWQNANPPFICTKIATTMTECRGTGVCSCVSLSTLWTVTVNTVLRCFTEWRCFGLHENVCMRTYPNKYVWINLPKERIIQSMALLLHGQRAVQYSEVKVSRFHPRPNLLQGKQHKSFI
jgi:hypothetical protein